MTSPQRVISDENQPPPIAEGRSSLLADPEPLPSNVSPHRLRRGLVRLGGLVAIAVVVVTLGPGLGELRRRFADARPIWIVVACGFEVLSVLAYVPAFRAVFCRRMSWSTSYKIAVAEEGAGSLFPLGGAGSLALGVWALRRGVMPADEIARKTVAFFLLTSAVPVAMLLVLGAGLATGVFALRRSWRCEQRTALCAATTTTLVLRAAHGRITPSEAGHGRVMPGLRRETHRARDPRGFRRRARRVRARRIAFDQRREP
jgi:hypothetical protein